MAEELKINTTSANDKAKALNNVNQKKYRIVHAQGNNVPKIYSVEVLLRSLEDYR